MGKHVRLSLEARVLAGNWFVFHAGPGCSSSHTSVLIFANSPCLSEKAVISASKSETFIPPITHDVHDTTHGRTTQLTANAA